MNASPADKQKTMNVKLIKYGNIMQFVFNKLVSLCQHTTDTKFEPNRNRASSISYWTLLLSVSTLA
jgi:hypothetical protein